MQSPSAVFLARLGPSVHLRVTACHQLKERVSLRKHEDERLALRSQMSVEEAERRLIEDIKADEKEKAEVGCYLLIVVLASLRGGRPRESAIFHGRYSGKAFPVNAPFESMKIGSLPLLFVAARTTPTVTYIRGYPEGS